MLYFFLNQQLKQVECFIVISKEKYVHINENALKLLVSQIRKNKILYHKKYLKIFLLRVYILLLPCLTMIFCLCSALVDPKYLNLNNLFVH